MAYRLNINFEDSKAVYEEPESLKAAIRKFVNYHNSVTGSML